MSDLYHNILLVCSAKNESFGTGFPIWENNGTTWVITCAHVLEGIGDNKQIRVKGLSADVIASDKAIDLALLEVKGLQVSPLQLKPINHPLPRVSLDIYGYSKLDDRGMRKVIPVCTELGNLTQFLYQGENVEEKEALEVEAWELNVVDAKYQLQNGYSGSPVVCRETKKVIAITSHKVAKSGGYAIALVNLLKLYSDLPLSVLADLPISWQYRTQLEKILALYAIDEKERYYSCLSAAPSQQVSQRPIETATLSELIDWLAGFAHNEKQLPLLDFVKNIMSKQTNSKLEDDINKWQQKVLAHLNISKIPKIETTCSSPDAEHVSLMLIIRCKKDNNQVEENIATYTIEAWLYYTSQKIDLLIENRQIKHPKVNIHQNNKEIFEAEISKILKEIFDLIEQRPDESEIFPNLRLEVFLDTQLLYMAANQWLEYPDESACPVGRNYELIVRSACRLDKGHWRRNLKAWWRQAENNGLLEKTLAEVKKTCCSPEEKTNYLKWKKDNYMLIIYLFRPSIDFFIAPMNCGVPTAIWSNCQEHTIQEQDLKNLLEIKLKEIPQTLFENRQDRLENDPIHHITLFWDDPNRTPYNPRKLRR